ncbi:hypothetical protein LPMP_353320 [Leishmania panamensis]|uniref:Uncharacterized protein n=1 Tax=Leishmania panamensis TaxID=5679 RepID=A0A088S2I2_LEIPA|nr:hypothetical protein LPMP_353320 [Leishmania panamensis]AIO02469.1 hypothetical protein LPMP_353320 [Leishmania panamensis]
MENVQASPCERDDVQTTAATKAANNTGVRRRRMGEVYPIMKNTIYSDEECDVVVLNSWDCGTLFIRYLNGLFQYFVRNPKPMGLILTTAIILLFFKYSQQVVVKAVNAAVRAHPGLEPTDTLRSAVMSFTEELRGLEQVVQTIGWAYMRNSVIGYDISTSADTTFFSLVSSFQSSFTANVKTYVVYTLPRAASTGFTSAHWGQIGCASEDNNSSVCFYVDENGTVRPWNTVTNASDGGPSMSGVYIEGCMPDLLSVATTATKGSTLAASGVWTRASMTCSIFSQKPVRTVTYLLPIAFNAEGYATAMAGIDVSVGLLINSVKVTATPNIELVVVDNRYSASEGGQFVYDSFNESIFWSTSYGVLNAPVSRVRDLAEAIWRENDGTLAVNGSFYLNGLIYQSLTMMSHWTLIASSPLALSVAEVAATLSAFVKESKGIAAAVSGLYHDCEIAATKQQNSITVESFGQIEFAFGIQLHSLYTPYVLAGAEEGSSSSSCASSNATAKNTAPQASLHSSFSSAAAAFSGAGATNNSLHEFSTGSGSVNHVSSSSSAPAQPLVPSSTANDAIAIPVASTDSSGKTMEETVALPATTGRRPVNMFGVDAAWSASGGSAAAATRHKWGVCGCTYSSSTQMTCFYTDSNQLETFFEGSVFSDSAKDKIETRKLSTSLHGTFTKQYIEGNTATAGFWTKPYLRTDTTGNTSVIVSYVYPSVYDSNGYVTRATVLDTTAGWMASTLKVNQHSGTTALYLIDRRDEGTFLASSTAAHAVNAMYTALSTPDPEFDRIASAVYSTAGNTWERSLSLHMGSTLVNYQVLEGQWGVIEVMPGDVALQRYLPTPAVTGATDALRLLPHEETVQLFLYVGSILLVFFLNLLILGCSRLGQQ